MLDIQVMSKNAEIINLLQNNLKSSRSQLESLVLGDYDEQYADHLGWFNVMENLSLKQIEQIIEFASKIQKECEYFVLIGVGGSNNAARAAIALLNKKSPVKIIYAGNHLSAKEMNQVLQLINDYHVHIHCIAKNFETLEPGLTFRILRQATINKYGSAASTYISAIGTKNSLLEKICKQHQYTFFEFPQTVGGRYSSLTSVGLVSMAVAGLDIDQMVEGGKAIEKELKENVSITNQALIYASARKLMYKLGYPIELLTAFHPEFRDFSRWWWQLFGESEGKNKGGIFPVTATYSEDLHSIGQYVQEGANLLFETVLQIKNLKEDLRIPESTIVDQFDYLESFTLNEINEAASKATIQAHLNKLPIIIEISIDELDEFHLGALFYYFEFSVYLSSILHQVNPFDQPGVEAYKQLMFKTLGKSFEASQSLA